MSEDTTLERFATPGGGGDGEPATGAGAENLESETSGPPVASTCRWRPDGQSCPSCGGDVARLWRVDDALVCSDCKPWSEGA